MSDFSTSNTGRLMTLSFGIAFAGGGAAAVLHSIPVMSTALLVPAVIAVLALPQALGEHWFQAVLSAILLPPALLLYALGAPLLAAYRPDAGYALIALGLGTFALALRPTQSLGVPAVVMAEQHS